MICEIDNEEQKNNNSTPVERKRPNTANITSVNKTSSKHLLERQCRSNILLNVAQKSEWAKQGLALSNIELKKKAQQLVITEKKVEYLEQAAIEYKDKVEDKFEELKQEWKIKIAVLYKGMKEE